MPIVENDLMEPDSPSCLEVEIRLLRQRSLEHLARLLADEWIDQREKD